MLIPHCSDARALCNGINLWCVRVCLACLDQLPYNYHLHFAKRVYQFHKCVSYPANPVWFAFNLRDLIEWMSLVPLGVCSSAAHLVQCWY